jgi:Protein of unknown function (DUF559)/Transcriptional regulator, AbiEi antitoxin
VAPELRQVRVDSRRTISTEPVGRLAASQWGVVSRDQLARLGYGRSAIRRLADRGYLVRLYLAAFAVGHVPPTTEGRLVAALFHAGFGAALSHTTAAWWWGLIDARPTTIHIATPHRRAPARYLRLHRRRRVDRVFERRLPVTPVPRTLLDLAATVDFRTLRRALAEADHRKLLDPAAVHAELGHGRPGSKALREALALHLPELANANGELEVAFLFLVERAELPLPEPNAVVEGLKVDALWRERRLVVELDGHATHANPVANEEDRRRELILRRAGYCVLRYTWQQVAQQPAEVVEDLRRALSTTPAVARGVSSVRGR